MARSTRSGLFAEIARNHRKAVLHFVARTGFGASILRIFEKGAGDLLRNYLLRRVRPSDLARLRTQDRFDRFRYNLVAAFPPQVRLRSGGVPGFGHKAKVINLYLKTLTLSNEFFDQLTARRLRHLLHVPLDSIVLGRVRRDFKPELAAAGLRRAQLRLSALTRTVYDQVQAILRAEAKKARVPTVWYDDQWALRE